MKEYGCCPKLKRRENGGLRRSIILKNKCIG
jgi:hypothetical protein